MKQEDHKQGCLVLVNCEYIFSEYICKMNRADSTFLVVCLHSIVLSAPSDIINAYFMFQNSENTDNIPSFYISIVPLNVWHNNQYTKDMFGTNIRIKLKTWGFTHIPEICVHPPNVLPEYQERMKNVGLYLYTS